jgi:hypothetical protein
MPRPPILALFSAKWTAKRFQNAETCDSGILALPEYSQEKGSRVDFCHQHNLVDPESAGRERNFGIRVTLPASDTMRKVLGDDYERLHWYASEDERDDAFDDMAARHGYYRKTDTPTQILEKITR